MDSAIKALVEYFNGPNVAKHSIYLQMQTRADDAREFFKVRNALGIDGYMDDAEAERRVKAKLRGQSDSPATCGLKRPAGGVRREDFGKER